MNFNTDGFNERTNYIHNANDKNRLNNMGSSNIDSSFAKMKVDENKPNVETAGNDNVFITEQVRGNREDFILRSNSMRNANIKGNLDNPVSNALNRNRFKKF